MIPGSNKPRDLKKKLIADSIRANRQFIRDGKAVGTLANNVSQENAERILAR